MLVCLDLPRFRGEVRSWDQGTSFDCIVSSSLGQSFGSAESIFSSRPARCQGRRVERLSRTGRSSITANICAVCFSKLDVLPPRGFAAELPVSCSRCAHGATYDTNDL
jgi:hypothetical protein